MFRTITACSVGWLTVSPPSCLITSLACSTFHAVDLEVIETIKRSTRPYFVLQGNVCALLAAKDHVNVFLYDGGIVPDPDGIITAGHNNKTARTVAFWQGDAINGPALIAMFRQIIADNRAGGWRKLKPDAPAGA